MKTEYDAIIIGGGPAGSTAAILLARAGWSVALVEKQAFPRRKVCGECIAATNLPLLDTLGVGARFDALAGPALRSVALYLGDTSVVAPLPPHGAPHAWGRALGREHLDTLLLTRAAEVGATVLQPCTAKRMAREGGLHTCEVVAADKRATTLRAPMLIAAHGSWEPDPSLATGHRAQRPSDLFAFKANFRDAQLAPGLLAVLAFPGGYGGIVLGDHGRTTLAFCIRRDTLRALRARSPGVRAATVAQAHVETSCASVRVALSGAALEAPWLGVGPIQPGLRAPWRDDGVWAIGNVAGEAHPILGEGMSMALQSAWLLCERLIPQRAALLAGQAHAEVGRDYANAWRRNFVPRMRVAATFAHLAMRPQASSVLLPLLRHWPQLLTAGARLGGKVRPLH